MRLRKAVVATVVFLVTLEGVLQIGALVMTAFVAPPTAPTGGSVLCVGDSYTFGIGATSPETSYPGQLGKQLAARGIANPGVVNAGFPGQHSGDVLTKLPNQMTPSTKVLCVLIGTNDVWRRPPRVDPAELARLTAGEPTDRRFQWCWRTGRLLQLITNFEANVWKQTGDGAAAKPGTAATPAGPTAEDTALGFEQLAKWGLPAGEQLGRYEPDVTLPGARTQEFTRRFQAGDFEQALAVAEKAVRDFPESPLALQHLVTAAARTGQRSRASVAIDRLVQLCKDKPSADATECLIESYKTSGQPELAIELARKRIAEQPLSIMAWSTLQHSAFYLGRNEDCLEAMPETIRLLGRRDPLRSGFIARNYARLFLKEDPKKVVGLLVGAHFVDANISETRIAIQIAATRIARSEFEAGIAAVASPGSAATRSLGVILDEIYAGKGADLWAKTLDEHLAAMHDIAVRRGIVMLVLSYPYHQKPVEDQLRATARALGVPFVPIGERFDRELKTRKREDLFVPDGHCNDAGYAIMAGVVAETVAPLLAK